MRTNGFIKMALAALALTLVAGACAKGPGLAPASPEADVWMAGDSVSQGVGQAMPTRPWLSSVGNSGFTPAAKTRVLDNTLRKIGLHGPPEVVLVMAGVVDVSKRQPVTRIIEDMLYFEEQMNALDVDVIWIAEPGWTWQDQGLSELSDWVTAQPNSVDCRHLAGSAADGVHPDNYTWIGQCVSNELTEMGITWDWIPTTPPEPPAPEPDA